jgi:superfamily II DNA or RNA helicase
MPEQINLKIHNAYTCIDPPISGPIYAELKKRLGYMPENSLWISQNSPHWDGWITTVCYGKGKCRCPNKKSEMHFPTGLLSVAREFFNEKGIQVSLLDLRDEVKNFSPLGLSDVYKLRDYQSSILDNALKKQRGIIKAATGAGKTVIAGSIIAKAGAFPACFFVTTIDLLNQAKEEMEKIILQNGSPVKIGVVGGGKCDIRDINVVTVQTAVRALGKKFEKFDDEEDGIYDDYSIGDSEKNIIKEMIQKSQLMICDECITGDSIVITKKFGPQNMSELKNMIGEEILSFDGTSVVWKKITNFYEQGEKQVIEIDLISGEKLRCTENHPIMTQIGWVQAGDLGEKDKILCSINNAWNTKLVGIKRIKKLKTEKVFDITVDETHCFFANGMLVHNCQHWAASTCQIVSDYCTNARYRFGISATPWRDMSDDILIDGCFGKQIADINASTLISKGVLVPPKIYFVHIKSKMGGVFADVYKRGIVENMYRNNVIKNLAEKFIEEGRQTLILVRHISHGEILQEMIPGSVFLHGSINNKNRQEAIKKMKDGKHMCVIASSIFDEGVDVKPLSALILAGAGKSPTRALQRIGRAIRSYEGKKDAIIVDFFDEMKYMKKHSQSRRKIYKTEPKFEIFDIEPDITYNDE